ncbi:dihydroxyacetone kinase phosphoryl donor subunit DhaM [Caproicibacter sp.]|uniref:dihydroxyacetone kinase phosphoryl donor subunit DhaM n=1 Tax=Caproicibacter sp. TaxID=2814884 RepID=UPI003988E42A
MVGLVIVSHSEKIAEGVRDLAKQIAGEAVRIEAAGGVADHKIGTDALRIEHAIRLADTGDGAVVLLDLGSAVLSTETALEFLDDEQRGRVLIADAPLVEGTMTAAICASTGASPKEVVSAAKEACNANKL